MPWSWTIPKITVYCQWLALMGRMVVAISKQYLSSWRRRVLYIGIGKSNLQILIYNNRNLLHLIIVYGFKYRIINFQVNMIYPGKYDGYLLTIRLSPFLKILYTLLIFTCIFIKTLQYQYSIFDILKNWLLKMFSGRVCLPTLLESCLWNRHCVSVCLTEKAIA